MTFPCVIGIGYSVIVPRQGNNFCAGADIYTCGDGFPPNCRVRRRASTRWRSSWRFSGGSMYKLLSGPKATPFTLPGEVGSGYPIFATKVFTTVDFRQFS